MKLIADSGATKTDWALLDGTGACIRFSSAGYNPNYITHGYMVEDIRAALPPNLDVRAIGEIFFYGAGVTELQFGFVRTALSEVFPRAGNIFVAMDLLASARALLGNEAGFAVILGTGMNSCLYDGQAVSLNIDSLGFILGDEGSGAYMGKRLICDYIRRDMPAGAYQLVKEHIRLSGDELIDEIYTKPFPNRFCAQYCKFIREHTDTDEYFYLLARNAFTAMFRNIITRYPDYGKYELNCVGSVAWHYRDILTEVAAGYRMQMGKILQYPIDGLIVYHKN